ncbi:MAG TPA: hypothetical protein VFQ84_04865 [Arenimonas sp.]|uniref:hypothetical protein n=1 Tax=Arenimonas sp. TaxID=1872635 RepID=UPI002D7FF666|nr:hypothetical protein [Arenimonas sp.]HEU0152658.1 hypothetical protein [Arenimonas sp.]
MKRTVLSLLLALSAFAVSAQAAPAPSADAASPAPVAEAAPPADAAPSVDAATPADPAAPEADALAAKADARNCIRDTGTRIKRRDRDGCNGQPGESYTGEELRRTGASNPAEALRLLSPRVGG